MQTFEEISLTYLEATKHAVQNKTIVLICKVTEKNFSPNQILDINHCYWCTLLNEYNSSGNELRKGWCYFGPLETSIIHAIITPNGSIINL